MAELPYGDGTLPAGIRSRLVPNGNGLEMHVLEAGFEQPDRPLLLLLHGFPELAYSWRNQLLPLSQAGYHVVAPDQRGYGRTTGWDPEYDGDLASYRMLNLARDAFGLVRALGYAEVHAVVGHDFGSPVAGWLALLRPDVFRSVALMSAPFGGPPPLPLGEPAAPPAYDLDAELLALERPRKRYGRYYGTPEANEHMWHCAQGVHDFLRAYYHHKSADWPGNRPFPLAAATAEEFAKLPTYYVMPAELGMAETVARELPSREHIDACAWLPERQLAVYSSEYERTGFQGGLQWYRASGTADALAQHQLFAGRTIDVRSTFIAGAADWGVRQRPGGLEQLETSATTDYRGTHLVDGAGHWVQQEQPDEVNRLLLDFLAER